MSATFLLIHGALHGAWCWEQVVRLFDELGVDAHAIDLPGHGNDTTPREQISQNDYADRIVEYVYNNNLREVVLVGHSAAGAPLTLALPRIRDRVEKTIFLAAIVPTPGESVFDHIPRERRDVYRKAARDSDDNSFSAKYKVARDIFFEDESEEQAQALFKKLTPEPFAAYCEPLSNEEFFGVQPSCAYIVCSRDKTLPPERCVEWAARLKVQPLVIDAGHCVMLSNPRLLVETLLTCLR